ncbi:Hypothetical predicted protein [Podarcis lilfordi]|uniref:Uncharacterized protein n=1 Tax=Podarcis lilfordi TaxID=74358 RepID=A0AA35JYX8_9SAUR|nr:Hypothetical predicted protein [Podarcis lilfordi]
MTESVPRQAWMPLIPGKRKEGGLEFTSYFASSRDLPFEFPRCGFKWEIFFSLAVGGGSAPSTDLTTT